MLTGLVELSMASLPSNTPVGLRAIDRLKRAANLVRMRKVVILNNGDEFEFFHTPLTAAERERATKDAKTDDTNAFVLQLLVNKALSEDGQRMFSAADIADLKHGVRDEDLQKLELAILNNEVDPLEAAGPLDVKSTGA